MIIVSRFQTLWINEYIVSWHWLDNRSLYFYHFIIGIEAL